MQPLVLAAIVLLHVSYTQSQSDCPSTVPACTCEDVTGQSRRNIRCVGLTQIPAFTSSPEIFQKLDMDNPNNNIQVIQANAFSGIKVEEVDMSGQNIKLQSIHPMAFSGFEQHLTILKLQGDTLLTPPFEQLKNITNLQVLELQFFNMPTIEESTEFNYFPYLRTLRLRNMNTHFVSSESFKNQLQELTVFEFANNQVPTFPKPAINRIRKLKHLSWLHNGMTIISYSSFDSLGSLTELDLRGNDIGEMNNGSFIGITDRLEFLSLQLNRITKEAIVPLGNHNWPELEQLNLGHMMADFTDIPNGLFRNMPKLANLMIPGNKLRVIKSNDFQGLGNMHSLDLSENWIHTIQKGALSPMTRLDTLDLRSQYDSNVNNPMNFSLYALEGAELALKTLHIQNNHLIDHYAWKAIGAMKNLVNLDISGTGLSDIPSLLFYSHNNLGSLTMRNNNMTVLRQESLYGLKYSLEVIDISNNQIYTIEKCVFEGFNKLNFFFASQNSFVCDCNLYGLYEILKEITFALLACKNPANLAGKSLLTLNTGQFCFNPPISSTCLVFTTTTTSTSTTETTLLLTTTTKSNSTVETTPDFTASKIHVSNSTIGTPPPFNTTTTPKSTTETTPDFTKSTKYNLTTETTQDDTTTTISNPTTGTTTVLTTITTLKSTIETTPDLTTTTTLNSTIETTPDLKPTTTLNSAIETTPDLTTTTITNLTTETTQDDTTTTISNPTIGTTTVLTPTATLNSTVETTPDLTTTTTLNSTIETTPDLTTTTTLNSTIETTPDTTTTTTLNSTIETTPDLTTTTLNSTIETTPDLTTTTTLNSTIETTPDLTPTTTLNSTIETIPDLTTTTITNSATETTQDDTTTTISNLTTKTTNDLLTPTIYKSIFETILDSTTAAIFNPTIGITPILTTTTISNSSIATTSILTTTATSNSIIGTASVFTTTTTSNPTNDTILGFTPTPTFNPTTETTSFFSLTTTSNSTIGTTPVLTPTPTSAPTIGTTAVFTTTTITTSTIGTTSVVPLPDIRFGISSETKNTIVISWTVNGDMTYLKNFVVQYKQLEINNPHKKIFSLDKIKRDHQITGLNPVSRYEICFLVELTELSKQIPVSCLTGTTKGTTTPAISGSDKTVAMAGGVLGVVMCVWCRFVIVS
ncbi:uncharacterized protein LOC128175054 isoform X2 [Crassostrea angulata]|nr:uncharacterized protein LOC128175054 isoform X2 [Crassostrea angulata]